MTRVAIPKRLRFSVLSRDGFTCQYCGASAPDVKLHVDHIFPVARGGLNALDNLVTACVDCNLGKWAGEPRRRVPAQRAHAVAALTFQCAAERFGDALPMWRAFETILDFCLSEEDPDQFLTIARGADSWEAAKAAMYDAAGFPSEEHYQA